MAALHTHSLVTNVEQKLLKECENLGTTLEDTQLQLEREKDVSNLYHQRYKLIELAQKKIKQDLVGHAS